MHSAHSRRPVLAEPVGASQARRRADRTEPADAASQHRDQPIDRDHENVPLEPLDATSANQADNRHRAAPAPPPAAARQPCRLLPHPSEMAIVVRLR